VIEAGALGIVTGGAFGFSFLLVVGLVGFGYRRMRLAILRRTTNDLKDMLWRTWLWREDLFSTARTPVRNQVEAYAELSKISERISELHHSVIKLMGVIDLQDHASASVQVRQVHGRIELLRRDCASRFQPAVVGIHQGGRR
jgi:hypothetical protein